MQLAGAPAVRQQGVYSPAVRSSPTSYTMQHIPWHHPPALQHIVPFLRLPINSGRMLPLRSACVRSILCLGFIHKLLYIQAMPVNLLENKTIRDAQSVRVDCQQRVKPMVIELELAAAASGCFAKVLMPPVCRVLLWRPCSVGAAAHPVVAAAGRWPASRSVCVRSHRHMACMPGRAPCSSLLQFKHQPTQICSLSTSEQIGMLATQASPSSVTCRIYCLCICRQRGCRGWFPAGAWNEIGRSRRRSG
jgi:hypothetical protein